MFCTRCGKELQEGIMICPSCNTNMDDDRVTKEDVKDFFTGSMPEKAAVPEPEFKPTGGTKTDKPKEDSGTIHNTYIYGTGANHEPIGMWGYFGYNILFYLPIIGWIVCIIFSLGGAKNVNVRNYARSQFCILILLIVVIVMLLPILL